MGGWSASVYRQSDGGRSPATSESAGGPLLAEWDTGLLALRWIDELVEAGKVIDLGFEGLLQTDTGPAELVLPQMFESVGADTVAAPNGVRRDEWLVVESWGPEPVQDS